MPDFAVSMFALSLGIDVWKLLGIVQRRFRVWSVQYQRMEFGNHTQLFQSLQLVYLN